MDFRELFDLASKKKLFGWYPDIPDKVYRQVPAVSQSFFKKFDLSPYHAVDDAQKPSEPVIGVGSGLHMAIEHDPEAFNRAVQLKLNGKTKDGMAQLKKARETGLKLMKPSDWAKMESMRNAILAHDRCRHLIQTCDRELSGFAAYPGHDVQMKFRGDLVDRENKVVYDFKTIPGEKDDDWLDLEVWRKRHDLQAYLYSHLAGLIDNCTYRFEFIFVETARPHGIRFWNASVAVLDRGWRSYEKLIPAYEKCVKEDVWPGYSSETIEGKLPGFATSAMSMEIEGTEYE